MLKVTVIGILFRHKNPNQRECFAYGWSAALKHIDNCPYRGDSSAARYWKAGYGAAEMFINAWD